MALLPAPLKALVLRPALGDRQEQCEAGRAPAASRAPEEASVP